jgi:hypothetical protein
MSSEQRLDRADYLLLGGHFLGAISVLLISAASMWKMLGRLPPSPVFYSPINNGGNNAANPGNSARSYWDK